MSLLVRQRCQEHLDNTKLANAHVSVNNYKQMMIVTECGKPLITITGIEYSRKEPSLAEIDYSVELFEAFIMKHKATIDEYVIVTDKIREENNKKHNVVSTDTLYITNSSYAIQYTDGPIRIRLHKIHGEPLRWHVRGLDDDFKNNQDTQQENEAIIIAIQKWKLNKTLKTKAIKEFEQLIELDKLKDRLRELETAIQTCEI